MSNKSRSHKISMPNNLIRKHGAHGRSHGQKLLDINRAASQLSPENKEKFASFNLSIFTPKGALNELSKWATAVKKLTKKSPVVAS